MANTNNDLQLILGVNAIHFDQRVQHLTCLDITQWGTDPFPAPPAAPAVPAAGAAPAAGVAPPAGGAPPATPIPGAGVAPPAVFNVAALPVGCSQDSGSEASADQHPCLLCSEATSSTMALIQ